MTYYWDEFMNHSSTTGAVTTPMRRYKINFGESLDGTLITLNEALRDRVRATGLVSAGLWAKNESGPNGFFDIKVRINKEGYLMGG